MHWDKNIKFTWIYENNVNKFNKKQHYIAFFCKISRIEKTIKK